MEICGLTGEHSHENLTSTRGKAHRLWHSGMFFDGDKSIAVESCLL